VASCRQCQTSVLWLGSDLTAIGLGFLLSTCRRSGGTGMMLALAFCQAGSFCEVGAGALLTATGAGGGVSGGKGPAAGAILAPGTTISGSARALGSASLSDLAASFSANAGSVRLSTTKEVDGAASLIAIAGTRPSKQTPTKQRANHIVPDNQGSCRVEGDGNRSSRLNSGGPVASKCGYGACLRAKGVQESDFYRGRHGRKPRDETHESAARV
jgi:hypothetical protein